jgi:hypothetical protein
MSRGTYPANTPWTYSGHSSGRNQTTALALSYALDGSALSDGLSPLEASAEELFIAYMSRFGAQDATRIHWYVNAVIGSKLAPRGAAPFQLYPETPIRHVVQEDFLTLYTWPTHAGTAEPLNFLRLPVLDQDWRPGHASDGGFFQELTGWKPTPLQPHVNITQVLRAIGTAR